MYSIGVWATLFRIKHFLVSFVPSRLTLIWNEPKIFVVVTVKCVRTRRRCDDDEERAQIHGPAAIWILCWSYRRHFLKRQKCIIIDCLRISVNTTSLQPERIELDRKWHSIFPTTLRLWDTDKPKIAVYWSSNMDSSFIRLGPTFIHQQKIDSFSPKQIPIRIQIGIWKANEREEQKK